MPLLDIRNVSFIDGSKTILDHVSVFAESHDFISITGPSGSGKSTLLKICSHMISPTEGDVFFKDRNFTDYNPVELRRKISHCFQTPCLWERTVRENIYFPYWLRGIKPDQERIRNLFSLFRLPLAYMDQSTEKLSGGEKQRIALIRSIVIEPEILLLDEVTSALDAENTQIMEQVIQHLHEEGLTVLWVTHSTVQSRKYANKILTVVSGQIHSLEVIK